ncbi:MAG: two-component system, OmpR family, response regulator VicR [Patescibacteria group bacterium]|nr:two-component system, OmpR family, response regulator VicR [Patescibacteria group bacterium]
MNEMSQKSVLIVEDDEALNEAFSMVLTHAGYAVRTVFNGQEGLDAIEDSEPDLVILDLLMPVMDGKEFLEKLDRKHTMPVVVMSNLDSKSEIQKALDLGATRYILKAWASPKELVSVVQDTLADAAK